MQRPFRRRRLAPAALVAVLALAGAASAQVVQLPPNGQVNDDPRGRDRPAPGRGRLRRRRRLAGRRAACPGPRSSRRPARAADLRARVQERRWQTQGPASLNIDADQEAEAPVDRLRRHRPHRAVGRRGTSPTPTSRRQDEHLRQPLRRRARTRGSPRARTARPADSVPSLNIHTDQDAENPALAGGAAVAGNDPVPWVAWQEKDGAARRRARTRSSSRARVKQTRLPGLTRPGGGTSVSGSAGSRSASSAWTPTSPARRRQATRSLNVDPTRDGVEPDIAFTGPSDTVPWVVWYEQSPSGDRPARQRAGVRRQGRRRRHRATAASTGVAVGNGTAGQTNCSTRAARTASARAPSRRPPRTGCSLNADPGNDAEDPRVAAGTLSPAARPCRGSCGARTRRGTARDLRLAPGGGDHFELVNGGQPISNTVNDSTRPDITFSGNTPVHHLARERRRRRPDVRRPLRGRRRSCSTRPPGLPTPTCARRSPRAASPTRSTPTARPARAAPPARRFLYSTGRPRARLLANAYAAGGVVTGAAATHRVERHVDATVDPGGAPVKAHVELGTTTAYGARRPS